jgi:hypothetical protein
VDPSAEDSNRSRPRTRDEGALVTMRYVDGRGRPTERYPENPNVSPEGPLTASRSRPVELASEPEQLQPFVPDVR